ncbi:PLDc_N domain-containing protein [Fulvivirga sp. RKSG066]|uniref:PLD nuclease N-terminal domain-containing protein n=1 Tax=Fulvivirga aurantia TaxID=2529383 RepID=UPI0012BC01D7|nr:PLD nuclease N-terminal domain-containing protein [Fulvivirga aurantia]MTI21155.1 PLDc_N domain-containing protein [Fulvivirga aurantia]
MDVIESNRIAMMMGAFTLVALIFWLLTLHDIFFKNDRKEVSRWWILVVLIFPIVGSLIYWVNKNMIRRKPRKFSLSKD